MIPKIIHYCWFGGKPLPWDVKQCIASWEKYCPDYEIKQWNESNFDVTAHPFMKAAYEAKAWAFVSDYARLQVVYENGGIYLDTDVELIKPLDSLLQEGCYFGMQQVGNVVATGLGFGAEKGHPGIQAMLLQYKDLEFDQNNKEAIACPILNTRAMQSLGYVPQDTVQRLPGAEVTIYPPQFFDPYSPGVDKDLTCDETVSIHHYSASWTGKKTVLKRKVIRMIGDKNVHRLKAWKSSRVKKTGNNKINAADTVNRMIGVVCKIFLLFILFQNIIFAAIGVSDWAYYWDEIVTLLLIIFAAIKFWRGLHIEWEKDRIVICRGKTGLNDWEASTIYVLAGVVLVGLCGNVLFDYVPSVNAVCRDVVNFLKFPLGFVLIRYLKIDSRLKNSLSQGLMAILKMLVVVIFLFGVVSLFVDIGMSQEEIRYGIHPYQFLFSHPTYLVLCCVFLLSLLEATSDGKREWLLEAMLVGTVCLTMRTKGIAMVAIFLFVKYIGICVERLCNLLHVENFMEGKHKRKVQVLCCILGALILFAVGYRKLAMYAAFESSPREVLNMGAFQLLGKCFPIGSGFASFASHISWNANSGIYEFIRIPFYKEEGMLQTAVLGDAGYAYYIGQFGVIGLFLCAFLFFCLYRISVSRSRRKLSANTLWMYIGIALTSESILLNNGLEIAIMLALVSALSVGKRSNRHGSAGRAVGDRIRAVRMEKDNG